MKLFPFQEAGASWLASKRFALLADEMGLGKSAQAITACDAIGAGDILVICPAVARVNWEREFKKFSTVDRPLYLAMGGVNGPPPQTGSIICSYEMAIKYNEVGLFHRGFDVLILDEAHYLKSAKSERSVKVLGKEGICRHAKRTWALTGTPMPNHPAELWPLMRVFGATKLTFEAFIEKYCEVSFPRGGGGPSRKFRTIRGARPGSLRELRTSLDTMMLRRKKATVLPELPPAFITEHLVERGDVAIDVITKSKIEEEMKVVQAQLQPCAGNATQKDIFAVLEGLAQSVSTLRRYLGLQKVQAAIDLVNQEIPDYYDKVVLFTSHREVSERLVAGLRSYRPAVITGDTLPLKRQEQVDKFQNQKACKVFIGNIQAAGTAITLTAAHHVIFVEQEWVPASNEQALARCHRISQTEVVNARVLTVINSIDEMINAALRRKNKDIQALLG